MEEDAHTLLTSLCLADPAHAPTTTSPTPTKTRATKRRSIGAPNLTPLTPIHPSKAATLLTSTPVRQPQSELLSLPREMRDIILALLLTQPTPINTNLLPLQWGADVVAVQAWLSLSRTSRQLRQESHEIFFATNTFHFYLIKRLPAIPESSLRMIRSLVLYRWRFGGKVELSIEIPSDGGGEEEPEMRVRVDDCVDGRPVKKLKGVPVSRDEVFAAAELPMVVIGAGFKEGEEGARRKWVQSGMEMLRLAWRCEELVERTCLCRALNGAL